MELSRSSVKETYRQEIKSLEAAIEKATKGETNQKQLDAAQEKLDTIAKKYQYNENIGAAAYKLYDLQAHIHYFNNQDAAALAFINQAIDTRGESYASAEKLIKVLRKTISEDRDDLIDDPNRKKLTGLQGWLAWFVVGISLSVLLTIVGLIDYPSAFDSINSVRDTNPSLNSDYSMLLYFEIGFNIYALAVYIWLIVSLARKQRFASTLAIIVLSSCAVIAIIDYAWATAVFDKYNLTDSLQTEIQSAAKDVAKSIFAMVIWVPYFLLSKRVKYTLTR